MASRRQAGGVVKGDVPGAGKAGINNGDLAAIDVRDGVNENGEGFLTIIARSTTNRVIMGQLDPTEARAMALAWLESAEACEQDAAVLRCIRKLDLPDELAAAIATELRNGRSS